MSKDAQDHALGNILRSEREKLRIDIEKAARMLRVRKDYLIKLENDDYDCLPPDVYVRGVLRNYAKILEFDEDAVLAIFEEQRKACEDASPIEKKDENTKPSSPRFVITSEVLFGGASLLIVLLVAIYFLKEVGNFSKPPVLNVEHPGENETVVNETIEIAGLASEDTVLEINGQRISLAKGGLFATKIVLMQGINEITLTAKNKFGKITERKLTVNYKPEGNNDQQKITKVVRLSVDSAPVWISVSNSSGEYSETLAAGSEKLVEITSDTKITVEKGDGIYYTENGGELVIFNESQDKSERIFVP